MQDVGEVVTFQREFERRMRRMLDADKDLKSALRTILGTSHLELRGLVEGGVYAAGFGGTFQLDAVHGALVGRAPEPTSDLDEAAVAEALRRIFNTRTRAKTRVTLADSISTFTESHSAAILDLLTSLREG